MSGNSFMTTSCIFVTLNFRVTFESFDRPSEIVEEPIRKEEKATEKA